MRSAKFRFLLSLSLHHSNNRLENVYIFMCPSSTQWPKEAIISWKEILQGYLPLLPLPLPQPTAHFVDGVIGIFHCHHPSGRSMTMGSTELVAGMNTRNIACGVKAAGA